MSTDELLARFEAEYMETHSISPARRVQVRRTFERIASALDGRSLLELEPADLLAFQGREMRDGRHPNTVRKYMGMLKPFFGWAAQVGLMSRDQATQLKSVGNPRGSSADSEPKPYKPAEITEMYGQLSAKFPLAPRTGRGSLMMRRFYAGRSGFSAVMYRHSRRLQWEAQIALALELGLRRIELFNLTIPQFHYDNTYVIVKTAKQGPRGDKLREIPYPTHAREAVRQWLDFRQTLAVPHEQPWLGLHSGNDRWQRPQPFDSFRAALTYLGTGWSWHRLRHTCATEWLRAGMPLEQVRVLMGHADLERTLQYARIVNSDIKSHMEAVEAAFNARLGLAAA